MMRRRDAYDEVIGRKNIATELVAKSKSCRVDHHAIGATRVCNRMTPTLAVHAVATTKLKRPSHCIFGDSASEGPRSCLSDLPVSCTRYPPAAHK